MAYDHRHMTVLSRQQWVSVSKWIASEGHDGSVAVRDLGGFVGAMLYDESGTEIARAAFTETGVGPRPGTIQHEWQEGRVD